MDHYASYAGVQYSPLDMAEYVFWTGDERGVTAAIEEFLQEGMVGLLQYHNTQPAFVFPFFLLPLLFLLQLIRSTSARRRNSFFLLIIHRRTIE